MFWNPTRRVVASVAIAWVTVALAPGNVLAASHGRKTMQPHHCSYTPPFEAYAPPCDYKPYYYSTWNPYSIYSVYDRLSGGRQLCHMATEPCENNHRVTN
jgi:hypothetical protein